MKSEIKLSFSPGLLVIALSLVLLVVGTILGFQPSSTAHPEGNDSLWITLLIIGSLLGVIGYRTRKDEIRDSQGRSEHNHASEGQIAVHGFFSFALVLLAINLLASVVVDFLSIIGLLSFEIKDPIIILIYVLLSISLTVIGIYALTRTIKKKSDGIYLFCAFLVLNVLDNYIYLLSDYSTESEITNTITSIIWAVVFITYFLTSKQVKELFPPKERTFSFIDAILCVSNVVLALIAAFLELV